MAEDTFLDGMHAHILARLQREHDTFTAGGVTSFMLDREGVEIVAKYIHTLEGMDAPPINALTKLKEVVALAMKLMDERDAATRLIPEEH